MVNKMENTKTINTQFGVVLEESASSLTQGCPNGRHIESTKPYPWCY